MDTQKYITPEDVAKILGVSADNIRNMALTNKIPAIKLGKLWRFNEAKILRYIEKRYSNDYFEV